MELINVGFVLSYCTLRLPLPSY